MSANDIISDSRLAGFLKRQIQLRQPKNPKLDNLKLCGSQIIKQSGASPAVFLLSDGENARFFGHTSCRSAWSCPKCMPIVMAKKGSDIACAIDALATWYKLYPFMITFTLPHSKYMTCEDSSTILHDCWRMFTKFKKTSNGEYTLRSDVQKRNKTYGNADGAKNEFDKRAVGKKGEKRIYVKKGDAWALCREELNIEHSVRVYEYTWSEENGWHPHIHALFWTKKENFSNGKILSFEKDLLARWWHCAKHAALKYWNKKFPDKKEENKKAVEDYYTDWRMKSKDGHKSLFISRDKDDSSKVDIKKSSYYVVGWSGDSELTRSNYKTAAKGHFTPYQILSMAYENATLIDKYIPLYLEYCNTTYGRRRVEFSKNGITKIIAKWKKTEEYRVAFKKKVTEKRDATRKFKVVYWFTEYQWKKICWLEMTTDEEILPELLALAKKKDCRAEIDKLLMAYGIPITNYNHMLIKHVEEKVFENRMTA